MEIRAKRVPTPDDRIPKRVASDGGTTVESQVEDENVTGRVRGPIPEFDLVDRRRVLPMSGLWRRSDAKARLGRVL